MTTSIVDFVPAGPHARGDRSFSFELFPPQTAEGLQKLDVTVGQLAELRPEFFSVTFGAGGSTRDRTIGVVMSLKEKGLDVAPHLSCVAATRDSVRELLDRYREAGVRRIVALRGDLPSGMADAGEFRYAADLVTFIRAEYGTDFHIEVAAYPEYHPQARSAEHDLRNFKAKVDAGADSAITQYFFNPDAYWHFMDECAALGIRLPVIPGIMPILRFTQLARFSDACGAEIPRWIRKRLEAFGDDAASVRAFGIDVVTRLCDDLLRNGAPGLHFYTLNQATVVRTIWERLGL
ncbi:MAG: methylenetetrahydrofolate reductase [NAD(P)H] [Betaproteobacteria bacterium]|nr:methylenetetrahydrofolate reductase [NAD(P)H] [Betaproteobacteria bacterium]